MWLFNKRQVEDNNSTYTIKYYFMYDSISELKNYKDYVNKFKDFTLEEYEDELKNEGYQSYSDIIFFLRYKDDFGVLFTINLEMVNDNTEYMYHFNEYETNNFTEENINNMLNKYKDSQENLYIEICMTTKFYRFLSFYNDIESDEDEEESHQIPTIIENSFSSDNCIICLKTKPNILNFPCLHLSLCEECEKIGRFINCSICRKEINRKVKI